MKRGIGALVGLLAIVLGLSGCGGSSDEPLSKAEFTKQANAICKKDYEEDQAAIEEVFDPSLGVPSSKAQEELVATVLAPSLKSVAVALADLGAPAGDQELVSTMTAELESGASQLESNPTDAFSSEKKSLSKFSKMAEEYGLKECAQV